MISQWKKKQLTLTAPSLNPWAKPTYMSRLIYTVLITSSGYRREMNGRLHSMHCLDTLSTRLGHFDSLKLQQFFRPLSTTHTTLNTDVTTSVWEMSCMSNLKFILLPSVFYATL